jgi:hypothetical protein
MASFSYIAVSGVWCGHFDGLATYPANLCPLFWWAELSDFGENLGQPIRKPIEAASRRTVWQRPSEHFHCMLSEEEGVNDTVQADTRRDRRCFWLWGQVSRFRVCQVELALQIMRSDLDVPHRHLRIGMAE